MNCENCGTKHYGDYGSGRFCSNKCSRCFSTKSKRKEINQKVSKKMSGKPSTKKLPQISKQCKECGNDFQVKFNSKRVYCNLKCKQTGIGRIGGMNSIRGTRSKNEILFSELCIEAFDEVLLNQPIFNGWDADVIIPSEKKAVLWNGKWHYQKVTKSHSLDQVQNRDRIKISEIKKLGYEPYVIKDMGKFNSRFVKQQFDNFLKHCGLMQ